MATYRYELTITPDPDRWILVRGVKVRLVAEPIEEREDKGKKKPKRNVLEGEILEVTHLGRDDAHPLRPSHVQQAVTYGMDAGEPWDMVRVSIGHRKRTSSGLDFDDKRDGSFLAWSQVPWIEARDKEGQVAIAETLRVFAHYDHDQEDDDS